MRNTVDSVKSIDGKLDPLMDVFVLLLGGVNLLLLFLLATVELASEVKIGVFL